REKRQALLGRMLRREVGSKPVLQRIPKRDPAAPVPLSFSQERLWFLDQLAVGSQFYTESSALRLSFELRPEVLEQAINAVVSRHEVLRARIDLQEGRLVQVASDSLHVPLLLTDLSSLSSSERDQEVEGLAIEHAVRPFDLRVAPLLRTSVLKLDRSNWVFLLAIHHII